MREKADTIISLEKVSLTLPGPSKNPVHILHEISMQVHREETISVVGPSGSGKTSLLMLIAGVERATGGRIEVAGQDITHLSEDRLAEFRRRHVGIVFQNFHLIPTMTALENVSVALEFSGQENAAALAEKHLKAVGLGKRIDHYPEQLSGGEQQRVALARAFATHPSLLLADEPTGNLDRENGQLVMELLFGLKQEHGTTLLLITHDKELASKTSRQLTMNDGQISNA
jgi:putative ABC transport system ATP-binding protein